VLLVIPSADYLLSNNHYTRITVKLINGLSTRGHRVLVIQEGSFDKTFLSECFAAVLFAYSQAIVRALQEKGIPCLNLDAGTIDPGVLNIVVNIRQVIADGLQLFHQAGHRRVLVIYSLDKVSTLGAFVNKTLEEKMMSGRLESDQEKEFFRIVVEARKEGCTAVLAPNFLDTMKFLYHARLLEIGLPGDMSFIGIENETYSPYLLPRYSAFITPHEEMTAAVLENIFQKPGTPAVRGIKGIFSRIFKTRNCR